MSKPPRTLLVGLDGATWDLLDPVMRSGALPHLRRFTEASARARLRSVDPPVTIPAWYCAVTGRSPATLDAWGFTAPAERSGKMEWVSTYRPHDALWDVLGRRGVRVGVVNFPTFPAPPVHGYFVGGMLYPGGRATTHPLSLATRLEQEFGPWSYDLPGTGRARLPLALRTLEQKARLVETLEKESRSDLLFVLLCETDRVQHDLYEDLLRALRRPDPEVAAYWTALDTTFQRIVEAFHRGRPGEGLTVVLSDHGFGTQTGEFYTNRFLQRSGFLQVLPSAPSETGPRLRDLLASLDRIVPLRRLLRARSEGPSDTAAKAKGGAEESPKPTVSEGGEDGGPGDRTFGWYSQFIDWERTRAVSFPIPEGIYAVHRLGHDLSPEERATLKEDLRRAFGSLRYPRITLVDPEVAYGREPGPHAPLLLLYAEEHAWETHGHFNHHRTYLAHRPSYFGRQGTHRPEGILAVGGRGVTPGALKEAVPLLSLTPTLLVAWGLPALTNLDAPADPQLLRAMGGAPPSP